MSTEAWDALGDARHARKFPLYSMQWDVTQDELSKGLVVAGACLDGSSPIAVLRGSGSPGDALRVTVFNAAGAQLRLLWPSLEVTARLVRGGAGWSKGEILSLVSHNGSVHVFCRDAEKTFSLLPGSHSHLTVQIACCRFSDGLAALLSDGCVVVATKLQRLFGGAPLSRPREAKKMPELIKLNRGRPVFASRVVITAMAALTSPNARDPAVLVSTSDGGLFLVHKDGFESKQTSTEIFKIAVSPNGHMWVAASAEGRLVVYKESLENVVMDFNTDANSSPSQLAWVGNDAVAASWEDLGLIVVSLKSDWIKYTYPRSGGAFVCLVSERDACRVLTKETHELLQLVPESVESAFRLGSFSPVAMLLDASESLASDPERADEVLRSLRSEGQLVEAVRQALDAALNEFDVERQHALLVAASRGKLFCVSSSDRKSCAEAFVTATKTLRLLNVVRHQGVGLPLTHKEFARAGGLPGLAERLAGRGFHFIALKSLSIGPLNSSTGRSMKRRLELLALKQAEARIAESWAIESLERTSRTSTGDAHLLRALKRVESLLSMSDLALEAHRLDRGGLAQTLAKQERSLTRRIACMIDLGLFPQAAALAQHEARDRELTALAVAARGGSSGRAPRAGESRHRARVIASHSLLVSASTSESSSGRGGLGVTSLLTATGGRAWAVASDRLQGWLKPASHLDGPAREALLADASSSPSSSPSLSVSTAMMREEDLATNEQDFVERVQRRCVDPARSDVDFAGAVAEESWRLTQEQKALLSGVPVNEGDSPLLGLRPGVSTLGETVFRVLLADNGMETRALQLKKTFALSELGYWLARVKALARRRDWPRLDRVAEERVRRLGVVVQTCVEEGELKVASGYALLIPEAEERIDALIVAKDWHRAVQHVLSLPTSDVRRDISASLRAKLLVLGKKAVPDVEELNAALLAQAPSTPR